MRTPAMTLLRRLIGFFVRRPAARSLAGYGPEVLFAGWVELPAAFRALITSRRP
ncbi:MAG: hypothetical protein RML56_00235 [Burkholderiales bacterium]|nr:hypothetical protein [Burkholderiales bacterium]